MKFRVRASQNVASYFFIVLLSYALHSVNSHAQDEPDAALGKYLTNHLVASLVGYQTTREVANGIRIPYFSVSKSVGDTNTYGVLMYVIAPTNYAGKYFWLWGDDPFNAWETSNYFQPDKFYSFTLPDDDKSPYPDVRPLLFSLPLDGNKKRMSLQRPQTWRFFVSENELTNRLNELDEGNTESEKRLVALSQKQKEGLSLRNERERVSDYKTIKNQLKLIEVQKVDALRQQSLVRRQWKVLRERNPPGFAWGDFSYSEEWERIRAEDERKEAEPQQGETVDVSGRRDK